MQCKFALDYRRTFTSPTTVWPCSSFYKLREKTLVHSVCCKEPILTSFLSCSCFAGITACRVSRSDYSVKILIQINKIVINVYLCRRKSLCIKRRISQIWLMKTKTFKEHRRYNTGKDRIVYLNILAKHRHTLTAQRTSTFLASKSTTMASVLVPVAYVIIVFGGLFVFSYFYRKRTSSAYCANGGLLSNPNIHFS